MAKQLAFLVNSSTPSLKKQLHVFKPLFLVESSYFHRFPYIYVTLTIVCMHYWVCSLTRHAITLSRSKSSTYQTILNS
jgi:hypothetical protein